MVTDTTPQGPSPLRVARGLVLLLAALLLIAAIYYYFVPVQVASKEGVFGCGSASNPPSADKDGFQFGACQKTAVINQFRTYALLAGAAATALAAFLVFRSPRSDWEDDDINLGRDGDSRRGDRGARDLRAARSERSERPERSERSETRELRGARREDRARAAEVDDEPRASATDDWDEQVSEAAPSRSTARMPDSPSGRSNVCSGAAMAVKLCPVPVIFTVVPPARARRTTSTTASTVAGVSTWRGAASSRPDQLRQVVPAAGRTEVLMPAG